MIKLSGYQITEKLAEGGMAEVYLGIQEAFGRQVAIKIIRPGTLADEQYAARFLREAKIVSQISHANIIPVYDFGQVDDFYYMSMEYLPGGTLNARIAEGIKLPQALRVVEDIASALGHAHEQGIIHRDVKPDNILFRQDGSAVLMDFGIARHQDASDGLTIAGAVLGTPQYMSPEQIQGSELDGRSDLYALGVMFYEMLTKVPPYVSGEYMALAMMHVHNPLPKLPPHLFAAQHFLERLMAKNVKQRFQTGREVAAAAAQLRSTGEFNSSVNVAGSLIKQPKRLTSAGAVKQGVWEEEVMIKKGLWGSRYQFVGRLFCDDELGLPTVLNNLKGRLLQWHNKRKKDCAAIELQISVPRMDEAQIKQQVDDLIEDNKDLAFCKKMNIHIKVSFIDTLEEREFFLEFK